MIPQYILNKIQIESIVSFRYKGNRFVKGKVIFVNNSSINLILHTDYIGKNVEWFAGEKKDFNIHECNNFNIITNDTTGKD